ncbi:50S ribosomal protein L2 [Candidatus Nomurabacteria bacterium]|nr:50S ribosomal protein L2 [Candidatus Nomurabacteria bacterium]
MKKYKPTSAGVRGMTVVSYKDSLTASKPNKSLTKGRKRAVGRNNKGRITTRHKGGGHKRLYREVDFKYNKKDIPAKVESIEYDPNRSAFIALALYADGERRYVVAPSNLKVGDDFVVSEKAKIKSGNRTVLLNIPVGTFVYNVELKPGAGAVLVRSAGNYAEVVAQDPDAKITQLKMPSSEIRKVLNTAWASIGEVSNSEHKLRNIGKAGRSRHMGRRPTVRGSAMNPVDHPHGGGEGRQGIGLRRGPKTRQGKLAYGVKTRKPKKYSNTMIVERRKKKKRN